MTSSHFYLEFVRGSCDVDNNFWAADAIADFELNE